MSAAAVRVQVEGSLSRLSTDHLDILYAHIDDPATALAETQTAFDALIADGLVRTIACSNLTSARLREAHMVSDTNSLARYAATQLRATYLTAREDADLAPQVQLDEGGSLAGVVWIRS